MPRSGKTSRSSVCHARDSCRRFATRGSGNRWTHCATDCCSNAVEQSKPAVEGLVTEITDRTAPAPRHERVVAVAERRCITCSSTSGIRRSPTIFSAADQLQANERVYPLCVYVVRTLSAGADRAVRGARHDLQRGVRIFLVVLRVMGAARARLRRHDGPAFSARRLPSGYRNRIERWLPAPMVPATRHTGAGHRTVGQYGAGCGGKGIQCLTRFFGTTSRRSWRAQDRGADLLIGNNVLAHVPDILDFVAGMKRALKPSGIISVEFPHFLNLFRHNQFDTIYHEHFSYLSLLAVQRIFAAAGLTIFDVEEIPTHGGSLRMFARHAGRERASGRGKRRVRAGEGAERGVGAASRPTTGSGERTVAVRDNLVALLRDLKRSGARIAAYGAPAKGNTLLNYCGITTDLISFTVDRTGCHRGADFHGGPEGVERDRHGPAGAAGQGRGGYSHQGQAWPADPTRLGGKLRQASPFLRLISTQVITAFSNPHRYSTCLGHALCTDLPT